MNPQTIERLRKARDGTASKWVELSADDVVEACSAGDADAVTARLKTAAERTLEGRVPNRRGHLPRREIYLSRADLEHLLGRLEKRQEPDQKAVLKPTPPPAKEPAGKR